MMTMTSSLSSRRPKLFGFGSSFDSNCSFKTPVNRCDGNADTTGQDSLLEPLAPPLHDDFGPLVEPKNDLIHELPDKEKSATVVR